MSSTSRVRLVRMSLPPQAGSWCDSCRSICWGRGRAVPGWPFTAPRFLRRGGVAGLAYGGTVPEGVWASRE